MKRNVRLLAAVVLLLFFSACSRQEATSSEESESSGEAASAAGQTVVQSEPSADSRNLLVIYTPHDADPMNAGIVAFMSRYPDIEVEVVAGGTGELCSRAAAEAAQPQADVIWGGGADSMEAYSDYFEAYTCANDSKISAQFKDPERKWIGESPLPMVIIYNREMLANAGAEAPVSWQDCLNPVFRGQIAYCQPSKSGSAYTQLCTMILANGGGESGWTFVRKFLENLDGKILDSSGKCHKLVAGGEYMIGITIEKSAALYQDDPNIGYCYPAEGTSAVPDAIAVLKGCPHPGNAHLFVDFVTSYACQEEQSANWNRRPSREDVAAPGSLTGMSGITLVSYDFPWAASEKEEILKRFDAMLGA